MAFRAEVIRRNGFVPYPCTENMIIWYSNYLYSEWWDSLSKEEQDKIIEYREKKKKQREDYIDSVYYGMKYLLSLYNI